MCIQTAKSTCNFEAVRSVTARLIECALCPAILSVFLSGTSLGQFVQLPTFRQFNVNTTVVVPDGGSVSLGGVNTSRSGMVTNSIPGLGRLPVANRLFQNRSIGRQSGSSHATISARIIDLREMDEAILRQAAFLRESKNSLNVGVMPNANAKASNLLGRASARKEVSPTSYESRANFLTEHIGQTSRNPDALRFQSVNPKSELGERDRARLAKTQRDSSTRPSERTAKHEPPLVLKGEKR